MEAEATFKHISSRLVTKRKQPYSRTCSYEKSRVAITLVRETHRFIKFRRTRSVFNKRNGMTVPVSASPNKQDVKHKRFETSIFTTSSRDRKNVETFRDHSEKKLWDANLHPCDVLGFVLNACKSHHQDSQSSLNFSRTNKYIY